MTLVFAISTLSHHKPVAFGPTVARVAINFWVGPDGLPRIKYYQSGGVRNGKRPPRAKHTSRGFLPMLAKRFSKDFTYLWKTWVLDGRVGIKDRTIWSDV